MSDDVIKQFVVGLGWKIDKQGEKDVTQTITGITKSVGVLVLALEAAALAAAAAVAKIAASFDQLYYTSQRTGASVQSIRSLSYAFGQVGSSSESAVAAIEAYAKAIRTNPGVGQYVKDLGVKQTGDAFKDLSAAVDKISAKHPYYAGAQMAGLLGMTEEQYLTFTKYRKEMASFQAEYDRTTKVFGLNNEDAAAASNKFMTSMRSLGMTVGVAGQAILVKLVPSFTAFLEKIRDWIETHPKEIEDAIRAIGAAALALAVAFGDIAKALTPVLNGFVAMSKALTGHEGLQASMEVFAAFLVGTWLVKILGAFGAAGSGWGALLLRLGIPVAIGLAASGGGNQTPEQYRESLRNNPAEAAADAERNARGGAGKRWWKRNMPTWLGGDPPAPTDGIHRRGRRAAEADKKNYNFTGENADVLRQAAKELGTSPEDLATVISYESKFSPSVHGGTGNRYHGLIQFGAAERAQFGANDQQTFKEQMPAVVRYLKTRGFKPGMGLLDLYSTINAGSPGHYNASDGHGTVRSHVAKMQRDEAARVARFLASGSSQPAPAPVAPSPTAGGFNPSGFDVNKLTAAPALGSSTVNNTVGASVKMEHNTTIKIDGAGDPAATGAAVERAQGRANDLSLRNAQTAIR